uniref:Uncharacterized protein n=1 Tax=Anguilla anguilla TaxID=7936 RepID=A0A0E9SF07_ANGAN
MGNRLDFNNMHASKKLQLNSWENPNLIFTTNQAISSTHFAVNV